MSIPLVDALRMVDLEPGRVYRERVNGLRVEVTVSLTELPEADAAHIVTATEGNRMLPARSTGTNQTVRPSNII